MDLSLSDLERQLVDSAAVLLQRRAGTHRAREVGQDGYDRELHAALDEAGFLSLAADEGAGPLPSVLLVEQVAAAAGVVGAAASSLVAPWIEVSPGDVVSVLPERGPARHAPHADVFVSFGGEDVTVLRRNEVDVRQVPSTFGCSLGVVRPIDGAGTVRRGAGPEIRRWWRLAVAAEAVGTVGAAIAMTVDYVRVREQFGRPIGSFQAIQHRLASLDVELQAARWLVYEAAWAGAREPAVAVAAALASAVTAGALRENHQMHGAMGFTREYDLHLHTLRLPAIDADLGGASRCHADAARARWEVAR